MTIDIVGISEMQKCGLKYVIHIPPPQKNGRARIDPAIFVLEGTHLANKLSSDSSKTD